MDLDPLVQSSSKELTARFSIEHATTAPVNEWNMQTTRLMQRIGATSANLFKAQSQNEEIRSMLKTLQEKNDDLQATFDAIDKLEVVVEKVRASYTQVAQSLNIVEHSVKRSMAAGNISSQSAHHNEVPSQTYFPPPPPADIYASKDLFSP